MKPKPKSYAKKISLFSVIGEIHIVEGRKRFVPTSPDHLTACLARYSVGKKLTATFSEQRFIRSDAQLRYHRVLCGYVADHTGYTPDEVHDAIMRIVFGEKIIELGGTKKTVRRSMAEHAGLTKLEVVDLIEYDLGLCAEYDIRVPTKEELGYLPG